MNTKTQTDFKIPEPPRGIKAIFWRLPIWLYRLKLGWLVGQRMLLLTHIGRKSGEPRRAVLEVIHYDPETKTPYVASGFGEKSQWYRNISQNKDVTIQLGSQRFEATAVRLSTEDAEKIFQVYHQKHPNAIKNLSKMIGYEVGEDEESLTQFMRSIPVVAFQPQG